MINRAVLFARFRLEHPHDPLAASLHHSINRKYDSWWLERWEVFHYAQLSATFSRFIVAYILTDDDRVITHYAFGTQFEQLLKRPCMHKSLQSWALSRLPQQFRSWEMDNWLLCDIKDDLVTDCHRFQHIHAQRAVWRIHVVKATVQLLLQ